jgi:hypothetical protein
VAAILVIEEDLCLGTFFKPSYMSKKMQHVQSISRYNMILVCLRSEAQDLRHCLFIAQECVESLEEMIKALIFVEYH